MFKGFDRHAILKARYVQDIESWFPLSLEPYTPENADDLDEYHYKACGLGEGMNLASSGKVYAPWTTNQTNHDVQKDDAWHEALEQVFDAHGGFADWHDGYLLFVKCFNNPRVPAVLQSVIRALNSDLYSGPLYLNKHGESVSMFDDDYHHAFDFSRAASLVVAWFDDNSPSSEWTAEQLGHELNNTI